MNSIAAIATMTSKGQLTVPKAVREALGLQEGSEVRFEADPGTGKTMLEPIRYTLEDLWGFADETLRPKSSMSFEDMNRAKVRGASR
jgi:antitoxin PrlF